MPCAARTKGRPWGEELLAVQPRLLAMCDGHGVPRPWLQALDAAAEDAVSLAARPGKREVEAVEPPVDPGELLSGMSAEPPGARLWKPCRARLDELEQEVEIYFAERSRELRRARLELQESISSR